MNESSPLTALLSEQEEPRDGLYRQVCSQIISRPQSLTDLIDSEDGSFLLACLTDHGHRFAKLFRRLLAESNRRPRSIPLHCLASAASKLITWVVRALQDSKVELLISVAPPALETCMTSGVREGRILATTLAQYDSVVKRLINNSEGARAICCWTYSPVIQQQDAVTLSIWTHQLATMIQHCPAVHNLREELQRWEDLKRLVQFLRIDQRHNAEQGNSIPAAFRNPSLPISRESSELLIQFNLATPGSSRKLLEVIERLEIAETIVILQALARSFPCNMCKDTLRRGTTLAYDNTVTANSQVAEVPRFGMEVFGRNCGNWEVLLSTPALSNLLTMRQSRTSATIEEKLLMLGNGQGHMAGLAGSRLIQQSLKVPLFLNHCGLDRFIVWQIDVDFGYETRVPSQLIRVWDIVKASEIDQLVEHVAVLQSHWTAEKIDRCRHSPTKEKSPVVPVIFHPNFHHGIDDFRKQIHLDVRSKNQYFFRLISKFFPFTEAFLRPQELDHVSPDYPYKLSTSEGEIVCYSDTSSIIFGRSGTGKTTCLVYRLIGRNLASKQISDDSTFKQVLLTKSGELADRIRHDIRRILATILPGLSEDVGEADFLGDRKPTFYNAPNSLYPYVCTFEEFLQRLENTVAVVESSDLHDARPDRPMLDRQELDGDQFHFGKKPEYCVDFQRFKEYYWPKLDRNNDRRLPLSLVFAEIMGVVKGSVLCARSLRSLSYNEYLDQSSRIAPVFDSTADRSAVYQMFQAYEIHKLERHEVDYADRILAISGSLQKTPVLKQIVSTAIDEIYVDEVQDQRSVDLELLLNLVKDGRYFHAAGDTAQAISQESTFRFEDLKAMIYDRFKTNACTGEKGYERPRMFQLGLNYRSHDGIVKLGAMVMDLLWRTFPQTVDKLAPEEGLLRGPSPIMFLGCESDVLTKVVLDGSEEAPADKAKFGAEQVVLVRDEDSKSRVKASIGNIALILTILQSKGMEFDDVVLFDFFTSCPTPEGWRSLPEVLGDEAGAYDSRRYAAMCTELKQLYVAVTRARNKLFVMETANSNYLVPVVRLLTQCTPTPIVQIIKREDSSFGEKLDLLRADKSADPKRWIERGFDILADEHLHEALHCFEQADHQPGIKLVNAKIQRAEGSACFGRDDIKGAAKAFEASITLFLEIHLVEDAVGICRKMGWFERAAGLWVDVGEHYKAAQLFSHAELYLRASECYERAQMYSEAAEVLWRGKIFDGLVHCLVSNREVLPASILQSYVSLCKIPLKQNKLSADHRKTIISLLGSPKEREELLFRYEIYDALEELLIEGKRFGDLFDLKLRLGQLEGALKLLLMKNNDPLPVGTKDQVEQLIDFTVIGRLADNARHHKKASDRLLNDLSKLASHGQRKRLEQWAFAIRCLRHDDESPAPKFLQIENQATKLAIALQVILDPEALGKSPSFEVLLSKTVQQAITVIRNTLVEDAGHASQAMLAVCGVWKSENPHNPFVVQAWSPLFDKLSQAVSDQISSSARMWMLARFGESMTALHDISKHLGKTAFPLRCAQFLTRGFCPRDECAWKHQYTTPVICSTVVEASFLQIRRSWQERLIREITWISAFEQDEMIVNNLLVRIRYNEALSNVASGLEALLLFRLQREWTERNGYSSLIEQMQLATSLGVQGRFFRVFSHIIKSNYQGQWIWEYLDLIWRLERDAVRNDVSVFRKHLAELRVTLNQIDLDGFSSFHSVTTMFEYLTTYLIFRVCDANIVLPRSWLYLHLPHLYEVIGRKTVPEVTNKSIYQECLVVLIQGFCDVLGWLDKKVLPNHKFRLGQREYPMSLIQQRNAEILLVALLNLDSSFAKGESSPGFRDLVVVVDQVLTLAFCYFEFLAHGLLQVLSLRIVNQRDLRYTGNWESMCHQLKQLSTKYRGNNMLVMIKRDSASKVRTSCGMLSMAMEEALGLHEFIPRVPSSQQTSGSSSTPVESFTPEAITQATKLQKWWRTHQILQRSLMKAVKDWQLARFKALMVICPTGVLRSSLRFFFLSRGFETLAELAKAKDRYASTHDSIMLACEVVTEASAYDQLDQALTTSADIKRSLDDIANTVSNAELWTLIETRKFSGIRVRFDEVDVVIKRAKEGFETIDAILKEALKTGTQS
ncbi:MAG: hypothetical protein Q9171_000639 [Xanthocarpia ochracea]